MRQPATTPSPGAPSARYLVFLTLLAGLFLACAVLVTGAGAMFEDALRPEEARTTATTAPQAEPTPTTAPPEAAIVLPADEPAADDGDTGEVEGGPDEVPAD